MSGTSSQQAIWRDDPISSTADDQLGRDHVALRIAGLIADTHSWDSSLVFGVTGPWGSGKTSLIEMVCECLGKDQRKWSIARFTPWATSSTDALLTEFYAALSSSLPKSKGKQARRALATCAQVASPALRLVPGVGEALSEGAMLATDALARRLPWDAAFAKSAEELRRLNKPVLVVADDIDRLQHDELLTLLKVVRLLGRFPGVSYLLAYDEKTLFANLEQPDLGMGHDGRGRLFMEKIVQYPIAVPPLLPSQMLTRLDSGLSSLLARLGRPLAQEDSRLSRLAEVFERQLTTPRAIDRYLAQVGLFLSMHNLNEIDDVDLILLTLSRVQFPSLYAELPRWRRELTATPSAWQMATSRRGEPEWDRLLEHVEDESDRPDAREILEVVFPAMSRHSMRSSGSCHASNPDYFARYFVHTIPEGDIADADITAALDEARTEGAGHQLMHGLLSSTYPGSADLAISKLWGASIPERGEHGATLLVSIPLLTAVASEFEGLEGGTTSLFRRNERAMRWAAELAQRLPAGTSPDDLLRSLSACGDLNMRLHVAWWASNEREDTGEVASETAQLIIDSARRLADDALAAVIEHLTLRDEAPTGVSTLFPFLFIERFGDVDGAREAIRAQLGADFSVEDFAARFVGVAYLISANPIPRLDSFDQETFARFAPDNDPLYAETRVDAIAEGDITWQNRRAYVRGRARAPKGSTA